MAMKWVTVLKEELLPQTPVSGPQCIHRVPKLIKDVNVQAFEPRIVSFGPYHHGKRNLKPMEYEKRQVLYNLLKRTGKPIEEFGAALQDVVNDLMDSYEDLGGTWRNKDRFLPVMLIDGCFLLEIMRGLPDNISLEDANFNVLGVRNTAQYILRDMFMVENQVPLLALERIWAIQNGIPEWEAERELRMYIQNWNYFPKTHIPQVRSGLHLLEIYRKTMVDSFEALLVVNKPYKIRSAVELYDAGVQFQRHNSPSVRYISFKNGVLTIPNFIIAQRDETIYLNLIAYEQLRPEAGFGFQAYIIFMSELINSVEDVVLLKSLGMIESTLGSDEEVADLVKMLSSNVLATFYPYHLSEIHKSLNEYYIKNMQKWRKRLCNWGKNFKLNYFNSPWTLIYVIAAAFVLVLKVVQTYYTVNPPK